MNNSVLFRMVKVYLFHYYCVHLHLPRRIVDIEPKAGEKLTMTEEWKTPVADTRVVANRTLV